MLGQVAPSLTEPLWDNSVLVRTDFLANDPCTKVSGLQEDEGLVVLLGKPSTSLALVSKADKRDNDI